MPVFLEIQNGRVANTVVADEAPDGFIPMPDPPVGIGWLYDGETFTDPNAPPPPSSKVLMPVSFWLLRLSQEEVRQFNNLDAQRKALSVDDFDDPNKAGIVAWAGFMFHFDRLGTEIDLAHPSTQQGMGLFGQLAGLSEARIAELLLPPTPGQ